MCFVMHVMWPPFKALASCFIIVYIRFYRSESRNQIKRLTSNSKVFPSRYMLVFISICAYECYLSTKELYNGIVLVFWYLLPVTDIAVLRFCFNDAVLKTKGSGKPFSVIFFLVFEFDFFSTIAGRSVTDIEKKLVKK